MRVTESGALIAVVSDGAGSAVFGAEGAAMVCEHVASRLHAAVESWGVGACSRSKLAGACRSVRDAVRDTRARLADLAAARGAGLADFHATLVGVALTPGRGGIAFHIGDGAALAMAADRRWLLSPPANGEYADTTFFYTESDWRRRLRFSPIGPDFGTVFVMTDGVTDLALSNRGAQPRPHMPFFEPIARFLSGTTREEGERALHATLDSPAMRERTGDDKTLIWASVAA